MRLKFLLWLVVLLLAACEVFESPDANAVWRAWLQDADGRVIMVDARGNVDENPAMPIDFDATSNALTQDFFLSTGERLSLQSDARFPHLDPSVLNTIVVEDPIERVNYPFFFSPNLALQSVNFVQNGERILISGRDAADAAYWFLLERDGSMVRPLRNIARQEVHGTAQGFVYTLIDENGTALVSYDTRRWFSDSTVWMGEGAWQILHVESGANGYGPFRRWRPLAVPVYSVPSPTAIITTPTAFPTPRPLLYVATQAVVNTIDGEVLYLRDEASTGGEIVRYLHDRMIVDLLEGPVVADGYTWWRIRTEEGETGWAAEAVDTVTTLLPLSSLTYESTEEPED